MFRLPLLLVSLFIYFNCNAATFIVTSGLDAGPGTLREALSLASANGTSEIDYIYFSASAAKIGVETPLILSSSVIIDGTSFPGAKLGLSDAKVTLESLPPYTSNAQGAFKGTNLHNVEIYGLNFSNFASGGRGTMPINLISSTDIIIGAVGKGNIFLSCDYDVYLFKCRRIKISSNWFGIKEDRTEPIGPAFGATLDLRLCDDIVIGGNTKEEGNSWGYRYYGMIISGVNPSTQHVEYIGERCTVKNNNFGVEDMSSGIGISYIQDFKSIEVINNAVVRSGGFMFRNISDAGIVQGNRIGVNSDMSESYSHSTIDMENCNNMVIGGKNAGEMNIIAYRVNFGSGATGISAKSCGNIMLQRNAIYCISALPILYRSESSKVEIPFIKIAGYNNGIISGTASPGAEVEVFSDSECMQCEARTYKGSTFADVSGNWSMTLSEDIGFTASATLNGRTSEFLGLNLLAGNVVVKNASCGLPNGSISGIIVQGATLMEWRDSQGNLVGNTADLNKQKPGEYTFRAFLGNTCKTQTLTYQIKNATPVITTGNVDITPATCDQENGGIKNIFFENPESFTLKGISWLNDQQEVKGTSLNLLNVKGGRYTLKVTIADDCSTLFGPFDIPAYGMPSIDLTKVVIKDADCDQNNGGISGIHASGVGKITFIWRNENNEIVSSDQILNTVAGGKYNLEVKDEGVCGSVNYNFVIPEKNSIHVDETDLKLKNASCNTDDGYIKNLKITSAANLSYKWLNENGSILSDNSEIELLGPGKYTLIISNGLCSVTKNYTIERQSSKVFPDLKFKIKDATCNLNNGQINIDVAGLEANIRFKWVDESGNTIGTSNELKNVAEGKYRLYLVDENGCEGLYKSYVISNMELEPPQVDKMYVCSEGNLTINATSNKEGYFRLYSKPAGGNFIEENKNGHFKAQITKTSLFYISFSNGSCESIRTLVPISFAEVPVEVPNAFSPNGDGFNDYWKIKHIEEYSQVVVKIFNRLGNQVFFSTGYKTPFDGNYNGHPLPAGVYYYIMELASDCKTLAGSLTILR